MSTMGKRIRQRRTEKGMTLEELGDLLGVRPAAVNKWENGTVENIKRSTIEDMAEIFNCSPVWLMGLDDRTVDVENLKSNVQDLDINELKRYKAYIEYMIKLREIDNEANKNTD